MIDTLESVHGRAVRDARTPLDWTVKRFWQSTTLPPFEAIRDGETVGTLAVRVNHGRWIVDCPEDQCPGAMLASDEDRRFVCPYCASGPWAVVWPEERETIESLLGARRVKETRNWQPGEPVAALEAENAERGVE